MRSVVITTMPTRSPFPLWDMALFKVETDRGLTLHVFKGLNLAQLAHEYVFALNVLDVDGICPDHCATKLDSWARSEQLAATH